MRVAMVGPYPDDANQIARGVESVTWTLVQALKDLPDVTIDVVRTDAVAQVEKRSQRGITVWTVPRVRRFGNVTLGVLERARTKAVLRTIRPDVIHNQSRFASVYLLLGADRTHCHACARTHVPREALREGAVRLVSRRDRNVARAQGSCRGPEGNLCAASK